MTVGKTKLAIPCGVWDCHMGMDNTGLFARITVTCKNACQYSILHILFPVLSLHLIRLEFIQKIFIKSHLRNKIPVVYASGTFDCSVKSDETPFVCVRM